MSYRPKPGTLRSVQAAGRGIVIKIEGDGESARRALEMVERELHQVGDAGEREGERIAQSMERVRNALETVGLYMGIREGIQVLKEFTAGSAEFGEKMSMAATRTGMTVESLSVLHYAAELAHTDFDQLQGGIGKMAVSLDSAAHGNKNLAAAFAQIGVDAKSASSQADGVDSTFRKLAATLANTENAQQRDAVAKRLMGKAGVELVPVLMDLGSKFDELSEGADKAGVKMTQLRAEQLAALDDEFDKLGQDVKGAGLAFTGGLAPALVQVFDILNDGKNSGDVFQAFGQETAQVIARLAALFYDLAAAAQFAFSMMEGGKLTKAGTKDYESYEALLKKGRELEELSLKDPSQLAQRGGGSGRRTGLGAGDYDGTAGAKLKSGNAIVEAATQLEAERARAESAARKVADAVQLAEVEGQHKMLLISDQEFFDRKFALQKDDIDAEQSALERHAAALATLYEKQHADKLLKRDKGGNSAEELKTQREMLQVQEQLNQLDVRRAQLTSSYNAENAVSGMAAELGGLKVAADLEKLRNESIEARLALLARETDIAAKKVINTGGSEADANAVRQAGELQAKKLEIEQLTQNISDVEADYRRRLDDSNDAASKGAISKRQAAQETARLNQSEAAALKALVAEYQQLAGELGGDYVQKAADLQEDLTKLSRRDRSNDFSRTIAEGMESMTSSIAEKAATAKQSFGDMVADIGRDAERLALKLAEQRFLTPLFEGMMGGGVTGIGGPAGDGKSGIWSRIMGAFGEHHLSGGTGSDMPQVVGEGGPEIWTPPTRGGAYTTNDTLKGIASAGGGAGKPPNMTTNIIDQSGRGVRATVSQPSWNSQLREMVTHVMLTDKEEGGEISQALGATG